MLVLALRSVLHKGAHRLGLPEHRIAIVILTVLVYRLAAGRAAVVDAFNKHAAVLLRAQKMNPDDLIKYLGAFGALEGHTQTQFTLPG